MAGAPGIKRHELVVGLLMRRRPRLVRPNWNRGMAQIDDHDLVADTVHLDKVAIGQRTHDKAQMCGTYMSNPDLHASGTIVRGGRLPAC